MTSTLYDISVPTFLQCLEGVSTVMQKGRSHAETNGLDLDDIVKIRLREDMLPFRFQVQSVIRHTTGAVDAILSGKFSPPHAVAPDSYDTLEQMVAESVTQLQQVDRDALNDKSGAPVLFTMPGLALPFTAENWVLSFALPNLYFHAATAYDILRIEGVALSKKDFLGNLRLNR